jgi:mannose-6-phosphate isomerase-like protein (cupin superfamily)
MDDFPEFMKTPANLMASKSQLAGIGGWLYESVDGKQMIYWVCDVDGVSEEHMHEFDEYFVVVQGKYTLIMNDQRIDVCQGEEYFIPKNVPHAGEFISGTRTIHCFGGKRADRA